MSRPTSEMVKTHVVVLLAQGGRVVAHKIIDLSDEVSYRALHKEVAYRCLAGHPELAGRPWRPAVELETVHGRRPCVRLEAWSRDSRPAPLAVVRIPVDNFSWIGTSLAHTLDIQDYTIKVAVAEPDHPWVEQWSTWEDEDFVVSADARSELVLPSDFSTEPLGARQIVREVGSWTRCVFAPDAWTTFLEAAAAETEVERGWVGQVRIHLIDCICYMVIDELVEVPAEAGQYCLVTHGNQFFQLHRLHERLAAYLHLHPRQVEGIEGAEPVQLGPVPSGPDTTLAWNLDASTPLPVVLPIAMFGARLDHPDDDVAAHAFVHGLLSEIDLEVLNEP